MKLDRQRLQTLYPQPTNAFACRMEQLVHSLPAQKEETKVKRLAVSTVLAWVLLAALLCATAYAVINYGMEWYYNNRFTAYQEHEPEKYAAIMEHIQSDVPQRVTGDSLINIQVEEASWAAEKNVLVVSLKATPKESEAYELHPMWNLDADGAYVGEGGSIAPETDGEDRAVHWLWTTEGFGPVADMVAPGKQLLLLNADEVLLGENHLLGDGSSMDSYVGQDGAVHTVLEIRLDFLQADYEAGVRQRMMESPESAPYMEKHLAANLETRRLIQEDTDGVLTLTVPFTVTPYAEDDQLLYGGGQQGHIDFEIKIK